MRWHALIRGVQGWADQALLEYVSKYATKDAADEAGDDSESDDEMSSVGSFESGDEEPAGQMEV